MTQNILSVVKMIQDLRLQNLILYSYYMNLDKEKLFIITSSGNLKAFKDMHSRALHEFCKHWKNTVGESVDTLKAINLLQFSGSQWRSPGRSFTSRQPVKWAAKSISMGDKPIIIYQSPILVPFGIKYRLIWLNNTQILFELLRSNEYKPDIKFKLSAVMLILDNDFHMEKISIRFHSSEEDKWSQNITTKLEIGLVQIDSIKVVSDQDGNTKNDH